MKPAVPEQRSILQNFLLSCGAIGSIVFNLTYFVLGVFTAGYLTWKQPISDLLLTNFGWIQSLNFIIFGVFIFLFAMGLRIELVKGFGAMLLPVLQVFTSIGLILTGLFTHEPLHTPFSIATFISITISFFVFAWKFRGDSRWKGWALYSVISGILINVFLGLFGYSNGHGGFPGLFERLAVLTRMVWSLLFTLRLLSGIKLSPLHNYQP